jgi:hypothetical protein
MTDGTTLLWRAVILRAIQDTLWVDDESKRRSQKVGFFGSSLSRTSARRTRDEAIFWLQTDNKDFLTVCDLAGMHPSVVRAAAQRVIDASDEQKKAYIASGVSLLDLSAAGELRPKGEHQAREGGMAVPAAFCDDTGGPEGTGGFPSITDGGNK